MPVGGADTLLLAFREFGEQVAQPVNDAVLTLSARPQLIGRRDQPWRAIGDDQPWRRQAAGGEITAQLEPVIA